LFLFKGWTILFYLSFFGRGGWGQVRKKIPAQLLQKKYKSCITAQSKKKKLQISPEKIFTQKKIFTLFLIIN